MDTGSEHIPRYQAQLVLRYLSEMETYSSRFCFGKEIAKQIVERYSALKHRIRHEYDMQCHSTIIREAAQLAEAHSLFSLWSSWDQHEWLYNNAMIFQDMVRLSQDQQEHRKSRGKTGNALVAGWTSEMFEFIVKLTGEKKPRQRDREVYRAHIYMINLLHEFIVSFWHLHTSDSWSRWRTHLVKLCRWTSRCPNGHIVAPERIDRNERLLASGASSQIYRGTLDGSKPVVVKEFRICMDIRRRGQVLKMFAKEASTHKYLIHPNVVPFVGITVHDHQFCIIGEYMEKGNIRQFVQERDPSIKYRMRLIEQIADGLDYLHQCDVIHGDLKGDNVLIDGEGKARLADFGLAFIGLQANTRWAAPECLLARKGCPISFKSDVWSFGILIYEVFSGTIPYEDLCDGAAIMQIINGQLPSRPTSTTGPIWELVQECCRDDPARRPDIHDAYNRLAVMAV